MTKLILKVLLTSIIVVAVSEIAKRSSLWAGILASLPLTSVLAFVWLYLDGGDATRIMALSHSIFWLVLPSLVLFLVLPMLLAQGVSFWISLLLSCGSTALAYFGMLRLLEMLGIEI